MNFIYISSFVEKSQVLMEQRNEGLLSSANQNQTRVLSLEQEKVGWIFSCHKILILL